MLLGRRAWSWRTHDVPVPYGLLPIQRKDRTIKPWDQTPSQQPKVDVIFNDTTDPYGGPSINFRNIDTLDAKNYIYVDGFTQGRYFTKSAETEVKGDLKLNTFASFIDYLKIGYRWNRRTYLSGQGSRSYGGLRIPMSSLPDYKLSEVGANYQSGSDANWLIGDSDAIRNSFSTIRGILVDTIPDLANPYPKYNPFKAFSGSDGALAGYGFFHYNIHLLFPVEGDVGARVVNTLTSLNGIQRITTRQNVKGTLTNVDTDTVVTSNGNYLDVLPSINAITHITPKLQLRLAFTHDVGRPSVELMNPVLSANLTNSLQLTASGGNAHLGPTITNKLDASLEWYFGSTGTASLAAWQWNQDGFVQYQTLPEYLPSSPERPVMVERPRNLGRGRHRGIEAQATSFFTFLPGVLKSFGGSVNGTLNITRQAYPTFDKDGTATYIFGPYLDVSKYVYNVVGFFERGGLNVRVAYNWQSRRQWDRSSTDPYRNRFRDPVERLDAAINYDINKNLTVGIEGSNLTRSGNRSYWGSYGVPQDVRYFSRNISLAVRTRF